MSMAKTARRSLTWASPRTEPSPGQSWSSAMMKGLYPSSQPYDRRVAGVVSGGGECKPALILDRRPSSRQRSPVALVGKVCCKVDARPSPVNVGDLLTTSKTPGHAMKATDQGRAFGAVIGKALQPLARGPRAHHDPRRIAVGGATGLPPCSLTAMLHYRARLLSRFRGVHAAGRCEVIAAGNPGVSRMPPMRPGRRAGNWQRRSEHFAAAAGRSRWRGAAVSVNQR